MLDLDRTSPPLGSPHLRSQALIPDHPLAGGCLFEGCCADARKARPLHGHRAAQRPARRMGRAGGRGEQWPASEAEGGAADSPDVWVEGYNLEAPGSRCRRPLQQDEL
jgi:hypothetical protein